jgi:hypothetical protein
MTGERPEGPFVEISASRLFCPAHGEHFRPHWPKGIAVATMVMFQAALVNDDLIRAVDPSWDGSDKSAHLDEDRLNEITARRPFCYWVSREKIREVYMESEIGQLGRCTQCGRSGMGGPYMVSLPVGTQEWWLCFECALDAGERLHTSHPDGNVWPKEAMS